MDDAARRECGVQDQQTKPVMSVSIPWDDFPIDPAAYSRCLGTWSAPRFYLSSAQIKGPLVCPVCNATLKNAMSLSSHWLRGHEIIDPVERIKLWHQVVASFRPDDEQMAAAETVASLIFNDDDAVRDQASDFLCPIPNCEHRSPSPQGLGVHLGRTHTQIPLERRRQLAQEAKAASQAGEPQAQPELWPSEMSAYAAALAVREAEASVRLDGDTQYIVGDVTVGHPPNGFRPEGHRPNAAIHTVKAMFPAGVPVELLDDAHSFLNHAEHIAKISGQS